MWPSELKEVGMVFLAGKKNDVHRMKLSADNAFIQSHGVPTTMYRIQRLVIAIFTNQKPILEKQLPATSVHQVSTLSQYRHSTLIIGANTPVPPL